MSLMEGRGGRPHIFRDTITTDGRLHEFKATSKYLKIRVATHPCNMFFTEADFEADENYIQVPVSSASTPYGEWEGPIETDRIWLKGSGGSSSVELVIFKRLN